MNTKRQISTVTMSVSLGISTALLAAAAWVTAGERDVHSQPATSGSGAEIQERHREGSKFEGSGRFEMTGDEVKFVPSESGVSYSMLENLSLERVSRVLSESREPREWSVVGTFTEYRGANYLMLTRAVVKQPSAKRSPKT